MTTGEVEIFQLPAVEDVPRQELPIDDGVNAPYDPYGQEAWTLTSHILRHRLGEYRGHRDQNYLASPPGSTRHGFQEEYPVDMLRDMSGSIFGLNLAAKGIFLPAAGIYVWDNTRLALVLRKADNGRIMMTEQLGAVSEPFGKFDTDLYSTQGHPMGLEQAERTVRFLRLAKKYLYLPDYFDYMVSKEQHPGT